MGKILDILADPKYLEKVIARLEKYLVRGEENNCWKWNGYKNDAGYPLLSIGGRKGVYARCSRIVYLLEKGDFDESLCVLHKCDNPECLNPEHLFLGTQKDNTQDMLAKGRGRNPPVHFGESHHNAKFSEDVAREILVSPGSYNSLAKKYGVSFQTIFRIKNGVTWKQLGVPTRAPRSNCEGESNPSAKLTSQDVLKILADSRTARQIAADYGVSKTTILGIKQGRIWRSITQVQAENIETFNSATESPANRQIVG